MWDAAHRATHHQTALQTDSTLPLRASTVSVFMRRVSPSRHRRDIKGKRVIPTARFNSNPEQRYNMWMSCTHARLRLYHPPSQLLPSQFFSFLPSCVFPPEGYRGARIHYSLATGLTDKGGTATSTSKITRDLVLWNVCSLGLPLAAAMVALQQHSEAEAEEIEPRGKQSIDTVSVVVSRASTAAGSIELVLLSWCFFKANSSVCFRVFARPGYSICGEERFVVLLFFSLGFLFFFFHSFHVCLLLFLFLVSNCFDLSPVGASPARATPRIIYIMRADIAAPQTDGITID
eukprot:gene6091-4382_t